MNVKLKPELERFVEEQVSTGRFASPGEVLEAALARLMLDPWPDALDSEEVAAIEEAEEEIARGEDLDWKEISGRLRRQYLGE